MLRAIHRARLVEEPRDRLLAHLQLGAEQLDRDIALEPGMRAEVDGSHPALAEQTHEPVRAEHAPDVDRELAFDRRLEPDLVERADVLHVEELAAAAGTDSHCLNGSRVASRSSTTGGFGASSAVARRGGFFAAGFTAGDAETATGSGFSNTSSSARSGTTVCTTSVPSGKRATRSTSLLDIGSVVATGAVPSTAPPRTNSSAPSGRELSASAIAGGGSGAGRADGAGVGAGA